MRTSLCLLLLATGSLPLAAQLEQHRVYPLPQFPPDIVSQEELPRDIVRVAPSRVRVDFENDRTRVLRLTLGAGEMIPTHDGRSGVLSASPGAAFVSPCRTASRRM